MAMEKNSDYVMDQNKSNECLNIISCLRIFSYSYIIDKALFFGQIFKMEILMDLYVLKSPESGNHIFSVWSLCLYVCVCVSA